jgi:hypothetical protein
MKLQTSYRKRELRKFARFAYLGKGAYIGDCGNVRALPCYPFKILEGKTIRYSNFTTSTIDSDKLIPHERNEFELRSYPSFPHQISTASRRRNEDVLEMNIPLLRSLDIVNDTQREPMDLTRFSGVSSLSGPSFEPLSTGKLNSFSKAHPVPYWITK